jgi:hypothetical protein
MVKLLFFGMDAASAARCFYQIIIAGKEQQQKDGTGTDELHYGCDCYCMLSCFRILNL